VKINRPLTARAAFTDAIGDAHNAVWNWGDGTESAGLVDESSGTVTGNHAFTTAGMYMVTLTVTDQGGLSDRTVYHAAAVFNPSAGYQVGVGSISSPVGSFTANKSLGGTANITGMIGRYDLATGGITTSSKLQFSYSVASLVFTSTTATGVKWLAMSGNRSWMKAEGVVTVNRVNEAAYALLSVVNATTGFDRVRVKIWSKVDGRVIYDNQKDTSGASAADEADAVPTTSAGVVSFLK
jgi:PKD repeat protein